MCSTLNICHWSLNIFLILDYWEQKTTHSLTSEQHNSDFLLKKVTCITSTHSGHDDWPLFKYVSKLHNTSYEWVRLTFMSWGVIRTPYEMGLAHNRRGCAGRQVEWRESAAVVEAVSPLGPLLFCHLKFFTKAPIMRSQVHISSSGSTLCFSSCIDDSSSSETSWLALEIGFHCREGRK